MKNDVGKKMKSAYSHESNAVVCRQTKKKSEVNIAVTESKACNHITYPCKMSELCASDKAIDDLFQICICSFPRWMKAQREQKVSENRLRARYHRDVGSTKGRFEYRAATYDSRGLTACMRELHKGHRPRAILPRLDGVCYAFESGYRSIVEALRDTHVSSECEMLIRYLHIA